MKKSFLFFDSTNKRGAVTCATAPNYLRCNLRDFPDKVITDPDLLHDLAVMQSRADAQESEVRTFIKEIRRYAAIAELDESVLNRLCITARSCRRF